MGSSVRPSPPSGADERDEVSVPEADAVESVESNGRSVGKVLLRGGAWSTMAQFAPLVINLGITPYIIHGFGIQRYGLFMLIFTITSVIGTFDGGLGISAGRAFTIFAGREDKVATTRLLITLTGLVATAGAIISIAMWFGAPPLAHALKMDASLRPEAVVLLRTSALLVALGLLRGLPIAIIQAHQRFAVTNLTVTLVYPVYVVGMVLSVQNHWGLRGVAAVLAIQQGLATLILAPFSFRYLTRKSISFYSRRELREFLSYASKVQMVSWSALFLQEFDTLVIGAFLDVKTVGLYIAGANFAAQLRGVPANVLNPALTVLGRAYGRDGEGALDREFRRTQRLWVLGISGWFAVGAGAAYFGVTAWLGPQFRSAGIIAVVLIAGSLIYQGTSVLTIALGVVGRPGLEARYSVVMIVANVALTIPLVFLGPLGVVAATVGAQLIGSVFLIRLVHRRWKPDVRSFVHDIPVRALFVIAAAVVGLEFALRPLVPEGAAGLLISGIPAGVVLAIYALYLKRTNSLSNLKDFA
jgi:O-antigen/teichoic acid export membrane protein